jgi:hypothetical protein
MVQSMPRIMDYLETMDEEALDFRLRELVPRALERPTLDIGIEIDNILRAKSKIAEVRRIAASFSRAWADDDVAPDAKTRR